MDIQVTTQALHDIASDAIIVGAAHKNASKGANSLQLSPVAASVDQLLHGLITACFTDGEFKGHAGEILTLHPQGQLVTKRVIVIGLGAEEKVDRQSIRRASATAARHLQRTGAQEIVLGLAWENANVQLAQAVQAEVEGALLGLYTFRIYKNATSNEKKASVSHIKLPGDAARKSELEQAAQQGQIQAQATNFARTLINEPPNVLTPGELANRTSMMAQEVGLECEIFDKAKIAALGMGGLIGVSQGSIEAPYFIILRYRGAPDSKKGLALVGKGITFDTGGISLKPAEHMDEMKGDMGGAAAVIGAMQAIAHLKPHSNVTAFIPTCENKPGPTAYLPGDVLRILNGKTIEIVNTDAEGRLVLADALSYAVNEGLAPIIDVATLTGGIVVALGSTMTGLFSNDAQLTHDLIAAGRIAGEKYWPMPLDDEYSEYIKSNIADIKQTGGRHASAVTAAKILENFVGNTPWAHLDIAGTSYVDSKKPYQEKGGVGVGVRTLTEFTLQLAQE